VRGKGKSSTENVKLENKRLTPHEVKKIDTFQPEGCGFESRSSRHVGTLGKSLTCSCLWRFGVKLRHMYPCSVGSASEVLSSSGLEEAS